MSVAAIVLVVFVSASDARDPSTSATVKAAQAALGAGSSVVVREMPSGLTDDDAIEIGATMHATAVAEIVWSDARHLHAAIHLHVDGAPRWIDRDLGFVTADAPAERGRTIGFALASMLPERAREEEPPPPQPPPATPATTATIVVSPPRVELSPAPAPPRAWLGTVEASAVGSVGVSGYGGGLGATLALRHNIGAGFALRIGGGARSGEVPPAQATSLLLYGAAGLAWSAAPRAGAPVVLGFRADLLLTRLQLAHLSADDPSPDRQARWLGGADAFFEAVWFFSQSAGIFAAVGTELAFGTTSVIVAKSEVAVVPVVRGVSELGLRARF